MKPLNKHLLKNLPGLLALSAAVAFLIDQADASSLETSLKNTQTFAVDKVGKFSAVIVAIWVMIQSAISGNFKLLAFAALLLGIGSFLVAGLGEKGLAFLSFGGN